MKILHLTLKKQWFDMIASGEKREEYREIKPYWIKRLCNPDYHDKKPEELLDLMEELEGEKVFRRDFDVVRFQHGYAKDAPTIDVEMQWLEIGYGMMTWGAEKDKQYFVISLGKIIACPAITR